jgi:hypothetical protein
MTDVMQLDPRTLTIGDVRDIERITGKRISEVEAQLTEESTEIDTDVLLALVYVTKRKDDPTFTLQDAENVPVAELRVGAERPTRAGTAGTAVKQPQDRQRKQSKTPGSKTSRPSAPSGA